MARRKRMKMSKKEIQEEEKDELEDDEKEKPAAIMCDWREKIGYKEGFID